MFPRYLQYLLTDFHQTFVTGASRDTDDLITFLDQKVKVPGHTIAAEAHSTQRYRRVSTRRYRRVQLFLVFSYFVATLMLYLCVDVGLWIELWLVTEYHPPGSLFDCLNRSPVSVATMLRMNLSIVSGLVHLHMDIPGTQGNSFTPELAAVFIAHQHSLLFSVVPVAIVDMRVSGCVQIMESRGV